MTLGDLDQTVEDIQRLADQKGGVVLVGAVQSVLKPVTRIAARALRDGTFEITGEAEDKVNDCFERAKALIP
jgi:hypothetical protein